MHNRDVSRPTRVPWIVFGCLLLAAALDGQAPARRATTIAALRNYGSFYHLQNVSVVGELTREAGRLSLGGDEGSVRVVSREALDDGRIEARGQFLDIGRMAQDDPRLIPFNLLDIVRAAYPDRWPRPGEELVLVVSSSGPPPPAAEVTSPPLRTIAVDPARFVGQRVTVVGQFRGRNLFGDLPEAPISDKWEFVLRSADAALWVTGLQPKGKTFSFDATKRIDSGRWVKVTGTARTGKGLVWLEGSAIELTREPAQAVAEVMVPPPPPPPVEVLFSVPAEGEADVRLDTHIRLQLSRDLNAATLKDHIRITYSTTDSVERGEAQPPAAAFDVTYTAATRVIEIRPTQPWERFRQVTVDVLDGVTGTDGAPFARFALKFTTGGS